MQDFSLARRTMVDSQLRPQGVTDRGVLYAMGKVERERYVPEAARALAYFDRAMKIGEGRSLMPPAALGRLLSEVEPRPGERALVIGSGTGYSAAVLKQIGLEVVALESDAALAGQAKALGVETIVADLQAGWTKGAPYDLIVLEGAVEEVPAAIAKQLAEDGRIAGALIDRGITRLSVGTSANGSIGWRSLADSDVAALPGFERPRAFTF
ncbi:MAG TPA: protein-L-isoaspartate O-methyltransferase [Sphingomicrobium sp.]|nr:protein-L-isoaspartate O-methyltransferase [Sphingomicrobium sp.]